MKKVYLIVIVCTSLLSCGEGPKLYEAQDEIEYLHAKLDSINSYAEKAQTIISGYADEDTELEDAYFLLDDIKEESCYREYDFYYPE